MLRIRYVFEDFFVLCMYTFLVTDDCGQNEADVHEPNHESESLSIIWSMHVSLWHSVVAFWGTHYDELLRIKQK